MAVIEKTLDDLPQLFDDMIECINEHRKKTISYGDMQLILDYIVMLENRIKELNKEN